MVCEAACGVGYAVECEVVYVVDRAVASDVVERDNTRRSLAGLAVMAWVVWQAVLEAVAHCD